MRFSLLAPVARASSRASGALLVAVALATAVGGCSFLTGVPSVGRVDVTVSPNPVTVGQGAIAFGTAYTGGGDVIHNSRRAVTFTSSNPSVATINPSTGQIIALAPGTTDIVGESGGKRDQETLIVRLTQVKSVVIGQRNPIFRVGATNAISAVARDSANNLIGDRTITYRSSDDAILTVVAGIVTPRAVGTAKIYASVDNGAGAGTVTDSVVATVTVPPVNGIRVDPQIASKSPGDQQQYTAVITDSLNATVTGRPITWSSDNVTVATIDPSTGLATARSNGSARIFATVDFVPGDPRRISSGGVTLNVVPRTAVSLTLDPTATTLKLSAPGPSSAAIKVTVGGDNGQPLTDRAVRCTSGDTGVAQLSGQPFIGTQFTVFGVAAGSTTVTCKVDDPSLPTPPSGTVTVTVNP